MDALLKDGTAIVPGDKVVVLAAPMRMWGSRARTDAKAELVRASGTVLSVTFERDFETGELGWKAEVAVKIPVNDPNSAWNRMYDTSLTATADQVERVLTHVDEPEVTVCGAG